MREAENASQFAFQVRPHTPADNGAWDDLVASSWNGTFLHTRKYLGYHGSRFVDRSLVVEDKRGLLVAVFPAAEETATVVGSHPGLTYGGVVHAGRATGDVMIEVIFRIARALAQEGYEQLRYKPVPHIYHRVPAQDDLYALWQLGAVPSCDLSSAFQLQERGQLTQRRRRSLKRAGDRGVETDLTWERIGEFWSMLQAVLAERHQASPVHSLKEICVLRAAFPDQIFLCSGLLAGVVVAGAILYCAGPVVHTQYLASSPTGRNASALDLVVERSIQFARSRRYSFFDLGTSNAGGRLNSSLYDYKVSFGGGGVAYQQSLLSLKPWSF